MKSPVILIGIGEIGGAFARGLLRAGHPVYPANRGSDLAVIARQLPAPELVLVAVAENALPAVLENLPAAWLQRIGLLQNELLPADWQQYGITHPTVISVWFEKKAGQDVRILLPSPVYGPASDVLHDSLKTLGIPTRLVADEAELLFELVLKNVYIVTTNCAGLSTGGTVSELWDNHRDLAEGVAREVIRIQESLIDQSLPAGALIEGMLRAFAGDPDHTCMGRNAPSRLVRALQQADEASLEVPLLRQIAARQTQTE